MHHFKQYTKRPFVLPHLKTHTLTKTAELCDQSQTRMLNSLWVRKGDRRILTKHRKGCHVVVGQHINVYVLDIFGTLIFALYGAYITLEKGLKLQSVALAASLTAVGGGTIRCAITHTLPFYLADWHYDLAIVFGFILAYPTRRYFKAHNLQLDILDAIGLTTFAYIGAYVATENHLGMVWVAVFAPLTAAGGGFIRDIFLVRKLPNVSYALPAVLFAGGYIIFFPSMNQSLPVYELLCFCFFVRVGTISIKISGAALYIPYSQSHSHNGSLNQLQAEAPPADKLQTCRDENTRVTAVTRSLSVSSTRVSLEQRRPGGLKKVILRPYEHNDVAQLASNAGVPKKCKRLSH